ncbi:MAG: TetR/AcrR family transcriptional regulator [Actinobacteria bacterium]|nr:TetR/AcrR family transcriptional regulator [Actinomycetota bacterium]
MTNVETPTVERIRAAALMLFSAKGFAATGIRELADAAGLSSASLYHHMGTKDDLLIQIMTDGHERLLATAEMSIGGVERPDVRLARLVQVHVVMHAVHNRECRVIDNEVRSLSDTAARTTIVELRDRYEDMWSTTLRDGLAGGNFQFADIRLTTLALIDLCTGVAAWFRPDGDRDAFTVATHHVDLALAMVSARRSHRPVRAKDVHLLEPDWFTQQWNRPDTTPGTAGSSPLQR